MTLNLSEPCAFKVGETYRTLDGRARSDRESCGDIMPRKRQVWIAVWTCSGGSFVYTKSAPTKPLAEKLCAPTHRNRIAVLGPIDVEREP